ncbi:MAG: sodium:calcium antiporter [Nanoarchaeota archaeon]
MEVMIQNLIYFIIAGFFLVVSGIYLVKSLEKIARFLGISEFTAAFIIMAVATSIPELFVGISSSIQGNPSLSLGNVIGASIIDLTLLTGIFVLMAREIKFKSAKIDKEIYFMWGSIILLVILYFIGNEISRIDGVILLSLFGINTYRMIKKKTKYPSKSKNHKVSKINGIINTLIFIISVLVLILSSKFIVKYSHLIALDFNIPEIIVGLFLISIATTLPELIFGINAIKLGHKEMAIGDQSGTVFANITLILGIVAIITPITSAMLPFIVSGVFLILASSIFVTFIESGRKLDIYEGVSLIILYLTFIVIQFFLRGFV